MDKKPKTQKEPKEPKKTITQRRTEKILTGHMAGLTEELKKGFLTVTEECTRKEERIRNLENRIEILEKAIDRLADTMLIFMDDGK